MRPHAPADVRGLSRHRDQVQRQPDPPAAAGSDDDAYQVFRAMLDKGNPPTDWNALLAACVTAEPQAKALTAKLSGRVMVITEEDDIQTG